MVFMGSGGGCAGDGKGKATTTTFLLDLQVPECRRLAFTVTFDDESSLYADGLTTSTLHSLSSFAYHGSVERVTVTAGQAR